jgi:hypothetical protein
MTATTERPRLAVLLVATVTMAAASAGRLVVRSVVRRLDDVAAGVAGTRAQVDTLGATLGDRITVLETTVLDAVDELAAARPAALPERVSE